MVCLDLVETWVQREVFGEFVDARPQAFDVGIPACGERSADDVCDFLVFLWPETTGGERAGADAQTGGHRCGTRVERDGVAVDGDATLRE